MFFLPLEASPPPGCEEPTSHLSIISNSMDYIFTLLNNFAFSKIVAKRHLTGVGIL